MGVSFLIFLSTPRCASYICLHTGSVHAGFLKWFIW